MEESGAEGVVTERKRAKDGIDDGELETEDGRAARGKRLHMQLLCLLW